MPPSTPGSRSGLPLLACLTLCYLVSFASIEAALRGLSDWYPAANKPGWAPPIGLFAPLWTVLYGLLGVALWQVWSGGSRGQGHRGDGGTTEDSARGPAHSAGTAASTEGGGSRGGLAGTMASGGHGGNDRDFGAGTMASRGYGWRRRGRAREFCGCGAWRRGGSLCWPVAAKRGLGLAVFCLQELFVLIFGSHRGLGFVGAHGLGVLASSAIRGVPADASVDLGYGLRRRFRLPSIG